MNSASDPRVLISGFADESAADKSIDVQLAVMAALGLRYVTLRFVKSGDGVRNIIDVDESELAGIRRKLSDHGLSVSSIGSPIGKVKIADVEDGTGNRFTPFDRYLKEDVARAVRAANQLDCRLVRGFSFYHPRGQAVELWLNQAIDQIGCISRECGRHGLTFGLEVEANLIGHTGNLLGKIHEEVGHESLALVFDGGNLVTQGFTTDEILEQFRAMLPALGWMHVKDYLPERTARAGEYVNEEQLDRFVPADAGATGHEAIFSELRPQLEGLGQRLKARGIDGFFVDLEPHLRGGGQFGGFSGPGGMGIACRALCRVLESSKIGWDLTSW